ncbi:non-processive endocellulase [Selenomonas sp. WCT3]|uniref:glycoside hydrolase family 9 protein n=1 Tax=Selenomonas sp. WCT3 TaxID=3158785 RepID=UPI000881F269|nr:non-processive endocellulase [Selenomonas ruminantium]
MQSKKRLCRMVLAGIAMLGTCGVASLTEAADAGMHVDQVGYLTGHEKTAMVTDSGENSFKLVDAKTDKVVYKGNLSAAKADALSEETLQRADFTNFNTPGTYKLKVGNRESYPFAIGDNVYAVQAVQTLRSYTLSRSGTPINDKDITGLKVKNGHAQDKKAKVYFTDKLNKKGDIVDVSGGWYDAGDYGKYTTTAGIAAAELLLAYEAHPDHFTKGQLLFPEGIEYDKNLPDALNEVKYEFDFMKKMMRKDGSTFHKVSGAQWPGFDKSPDSDTQERFLYGNCTASTAMYGASLAIGARVYRDLDANYAKELQKDANKVWSYLSKTKESLYRVDEGQESGSGPYDDKNDIQERLWMAAEMFRTTGDKKYEKYLKTNKAELTKAPGFFTWDNTLALAQFAYAMSKNADADLQAEVKKTYLNYADFIADKISKDGFGCALSKDEYTWASTKNAMTQGDMLLMAYQLEPKQAYVEGALSQIHYMFGRNSLDKSFLTGAGSNPPEHPHNRIHESTGAYVPGLLVGGPNAVSGGDPDQTAYLASKHVPTAKSYLDVLTSWSTNEYAIDYTGTAAYALAWFAKPVDFTASQIKLSRAFPSVTK